MRDLDSMHDIVGSNFIITNVQKKIKKNREWRYKKMENFYEKDAYFNIRFNLF